MDARLLDFITQVETLSSVRNADPINPVAIDMDIPGLSRRYRVVGSINEPSFQAYPVNVIWVVLDATSLYYRRALQLRSVTQNDDAVVGRITDVQYQGTWVEVQAYADLFVLPQFYVMGSGGGEPGPKGDKGDAGYDLRGAYSPTITYDKNQTVYFEGSSYASTVNGNYGQNPASSASWQIVAQKGNSPTVDYDYIIDRVVAMLAPVPTKIVLSGLPASLFETKTAQLAVTATFNNDSTSVVTNACTYAVLPSSAGSVSASGLFTAAAVGSDVNATVRATWISGETTFTSEQDVIIKNKVPVSLTIGGASTVQEQTTSNYTATVKYNDNSTAVVTPNTEFTMDNAEGVSLTTGGKLTAGNIFSDVHVTVNGSYTESGVTVEGQKSVTVVAAQMKARYGIGPAVTDMANYNANFINTVTINEVENAGTESSEFSLNTGTDQYGYIVHPASWGVMRQIDLSNNFEGGWDGAKNDIYNSEAWGPYEFTATVDGEEQQWYVYRKDYPNQGPENWRLTL